MNIIMKVIGLGLVFLISPLNVYGETSKELECLAKNIYYEAGGESYKGKLAVGQVTLNRAKSGNYPSDVCSVVYQSKVKWNKKICQFSWVCEKAKPIRWKSKAWQDSWSIAFKMLFSDLRHHQIAKSNSLNFHTTTVYPKWAPEKEVVTQIGNHIFYKEFKRGRSM